MTEETAIRIAEALEKIKDATGLILTLALFCTLAFLFFIAFEVTK